MYVNFELPEFSVLEGWELDPHYAGPNGDEIDRFIARHEPSGGGVLIDRKWDGEYTVELHEPLHGNSDPVRTETTEEDEQARTILEEFMAELHPDIEWGAAYATKPLEGDVWQFVFGRSSGELVWRPGDAYYLAYVEQAEVGGVTRFRVVHTGDSDAMPEVGETIVEKTEEVAKNPEWAIVPEDHAAGIEWVSELRDIIQPATPSE